MGKGAIKIRQYFQPHLAYQAIFAVSLLLLTAFSPIINAEIDHELEGDDFSIQLVSDDTLRGCSEILLNSYISVVYPQVSPICVQIDFSPSERKTVKLDLEIRSPESNISVTSFLTQQWMFAEGENLDHHIFTFPFIPADNLSSGEYDIFAIYSVTSPEIVDVAENKIGTVIVNPSPSTAEIQIISEPITVAAGGSNDLTLQVENTGDFGARFELIAHLNDTIVGATEYSLPANLSGYVDLEIQIPLNHSAMTSEIQVEVFRPDDLEISLDIQTQDIVIVEPFSNFQFSNMSMMGQFEGSAGMKFHAGEYATVLIESTNGGSLDATSSPQFQIISGAEIILLNRSRPFNVTVPAETTHEWIEELFVPANMTIGTAEIQLIWDETAFPRVSVGILPIRRNGLVVIEEIQEDGRVNVSIQNTGDYTTDYQLEWAVENSDYPDQNHSNSTSVGLISPSQFLNYSFNPLSDICSIGRWTLDLNLQTTMAPETLPETLDSVHAYSILNSTSVDAGIQAMSPSLWPNQLNVGDEFNISINFKSSHHNCGSVDFPYRVHMIGETESWSIDRTISSPPGITQIDQRPVQVPWHIGSGVYSIFVQTFRTSDGSYFADDVVFVDNITVDSNGPEAELVGCDIGDINIQSSSNLIQCEMKNTGQWDSVYRLLSTKNSGDEFIGRPIQVTSGQTSLLSIRSEASTFGDNQWEIHLQALYAGTWVNIANLTENHTAINPYENVDPIGQITVYPWPPLAGQDVSIIVNSTGINQTTSTGIFSLNLVDDSGNGFQIIHEEFNWTLGQVHTHGARIAWPTDCKEYRVEVGRSDVSFNATPTSFNKDSCKMDVPNLRFMNMNASNEGLYGVILNNGTITSSETTAVLLIDGEINQTFSIPSLEPNGTFEVNEPSINAYHNLQIIIDPDNRVNEIFEGIDNAFWTGIEVPLDRLDSDGDGLSDELERRGWTVYYVGSYDGHQCFFEEMSMDYADIEKCFVKVDRVTSNPHLIDTDDDGLSDRFEYDSRLNPDNKDTDGDGVDDRTEFELDTDPQVVELDKPEISSISSDDLHASTGSAGRGLIPDGLEWFHETFSARIVSHFEVKDAHLQDDFTVMVEIQNFDGEILRVVQPQLVYHDPETGIARYSVTITTPVASKENWEGFNVSVNATDDFGNYESLTIASEESLVGRTFTTLVGFLSDHLPEWFAELLVAHLGIPVAMVHGFAMGIWTSLEDLYGLGVFVGNFVKAGLGLLWDLLLKSLACVTVEIVGCTESAINFGHNIWDAIIDIYHWLEDKCLGDLDKCLTDIESSVNSAGQQAVDQTIEIHRKIAEECSSFQAGPLAELECAKKVKDSYIASWEWLYDKIKEYWYKGKKSSVYSTTHHLVYDAYMTAFVAGYLLIDIISWAVGVGGFSAIKHIWKTKSAASSFRVFLDDAIGQLPFFKKTCGLGRSASLCTDLVDDAVKRGKNAPSGTAKRAYSSMDDDVAKLWAKAIEAKGKGKSFTSWIRDDTFGRNILDLLKTTKRADYDRVLQVAHFLKHNDAILKQVDLEYAMRLFQGGYFDAAMRDAPEQFALLSKKWHSKVVSTKTGKPLAWDSIRGHIGEMMSLEKDCFTVAKPSDGPSLGGEMDVLCLVVVQGVKRLVNKEVKTGQLVHNVAKFHKQSQSSKHLYYKIEALDPADRAEELYRLQCGLSINKYTRKACQSVIDFDPQKLARQVTHILDAGRMGNFDFVYKMVGDEGFDAVQKTCLGIKWSTAFCQNKLDELLDGWIKNPPSSWNKKYPGYPSMADWFAENPNNRQLLRDAITGTEFNDKTIPIFQAAASTTGRSAALSDSIVEVPQVLQILTPIGTISISLNQDDNKFEFVLLALLILATISFIIRRKKLEEEKFVEIRGP